MLHDVTPVARRVANREKDGTVEFFCPCECFWPPRIPIDRIVRVLLEIEACLVSESVGCTCSGHVYLVVMRAIRFYGSLCRAHFHSRVSHATSTCGRSRGSFRRCSRCGRRAEGCSAHTRTRAQRLRTPTAATRCARLRLLQRGS